MSSIQLFNFKGNPVRTVLVNGEPYFVGKDVAQVLGYKDLNRAVNQHVDEYDRKSMSLKASGDSYASLWENKNDFSNKTVISESGVYSLIMDSYLPEAHEFKHWVTSEVLPSIRKHGAYMTPKTVEDALLNPDTIINLAQQIKSERAGRKIAEAKVTEMQPKALFADAVATSKHSILIGDLAKLIKQNGIDIGANRLFQWMRDHGYLIRRRGSDYNSPTQKSMNLGIFEIKETTISHADGHITVNKTPKVTGKGQQYFVNRFLSHKGEQSCNVISLN